ncbi:MAG: hypothetical protein ACLFTL_02830 [Alphaproteobacteria bacterium]
MASRTTRAICADVVAKVPRFSASRHADSFAGRTVRNITRAIWTFAGFGAAASYTIPGDVTPPPS